MTVEIPAALRRSDTIVRLRPSGVAWRHVVDDVVVLDTDSNRYLGVNATGAALWDEIAVGCPVGRLVEVLTEQHPAAADRAAHDVAAFLEQLHAHHLLEVDAPAAS